MIKIYETMYLEREKIKIIGLIGPLGELGCFSTFMVHLGLVGMRITLSSYCNHLWLTYGPLYFTCS